MLGWIILGLFAQLSFPFPYGYITNLIFSTWNGNLATEINNLQKSLLQRSDLYSSSTSARQTRRLNKLDSQLWLAIKLIKLTAQNNPNNNLRVIQIINALEQKRNEFSDVLDSGKKENYRWLLLSQKFWEFLTRSKAEREYIKIQGILSELVNYVRNSLPSNRVVEEVLNKITINLTTYSDTITPSRLTIVYKVAELISYISIRQIAESSASQQGNPLNSEADSTNSEDVSNSENINSSENIKSLLRQLNLSGVYIGNVSNKGSKYHFNTKCRDWKMLAVDHVLMEQHSNNSRNVVSSDNSNVFEEYGLQPCQDCLRKYRY